MSHAKATIFIVHLCFTKRETEPEAEESHVVKRVHNG
jgi:hypothetical protein